MTASGRAVERAENLDIRAAFRSLPGLAAQERPDHVMAVTVDIRDVLGSLGSDLLVFRQVRVEVPVFDPTPSEARVASG